MNKIINSNIVIGPQDTYKIPHDSIGKYFYNLLEKRNYSDVIYIDALTGAELTCGKLLEKSVKCATIFNSFGLTTNDVISVINDNSIDYCILILAAFYNGVALNPLNPSYTKMEIKHALHLASPKLIACTKREIDMILEIKEDLNFIRNVLLIGDRSEEDFKIQYLRDLIENAPNVKFFQPSFINPSEQTALVMLSSGTTGLPKGVSITHKNLRVPMGYIPDPNYLNLTSEDVMLLIVPTYHIYGMIIYLSGLAASAKVVVMKKFQPSLFLDCIQKYKVTALSMVPSLVKFLITNPLVDKYDISSVNKFVIAASPLGKQLEQAALKRFPNATIQQVYGITEMSGGCTFHNISSDKPNCVGILVPGTIAKVYDSDTNKNMEAMQVGELCFKSPNVMKGYINNKIDTKKSIDANGFYHTGDLGYYDNENYFFVVDRIKDLIKYKGFQVPPAELEALLLTHPDIIDVGVIGIPDDNVGQLPFAFVVKKENLNLTEQDVITYVAERISIQKQLHGGVQFIDEIPKNSNGKMIRKELEKLRLNNC